MDNIWVLFEILMINIVLSGDNAVVIAMASKDLTEKKRKQAVWWGSFGAVILRCALTFIAIVLLKIPYIQAAGGLLLFYIALKLLFQKNEDSRIGGAATTWRAVETILVADFVMSLDNVLAIAGLANGDVALIVIGIAISIPIVVWGSTIIVNMLKKFPVLVLAGSGILALTSGEMMVKDPKLGALIVDASPQLENLLPSILAAAAILLGWIIKLKSGRTST
ncbi:TerC family protein [Paenibacillus sediminis]|uniref:YjbE family integral membrane protein n=1 Tax=Paenibacillus sediminis TaxID=664909 RepID=A0ABS4GYT1_9BACL|nr:TerC family protein [Paenibacillus sediminis]MBP1935424.1 YjbE family integral membrane protein [Paenibacillus sediminis]